MDFLFFQPGKVNSLAMFFDGEQEKENFLSELDENTRKYVLKHSDEFHSKDELEVVASRLMKGNKEF